MNKIVSENRDFAPPLPIQYEVHGVGTSKMDHQKIGEGSGNPLLNSLHLAFTQSKVCKLFVL